MAPAAAFAPAPALPTMVQTASATGSSACGSRASAFAARRGGHPVDGARPLCPAVGRRGSRTTTPRSLRPPPSQRPFSPSMNASGDRIEAALAAKFAHADIDRVTASFRAVRTGDTLHVNAGQPNEQRAESHLVGLFAEPFHEGDLLATAHPWAAGLEAHWQVVRDELTAALDADQVEWAAACREEATAYGPQWSTLVLQDRTWHAGNVHRFPKTVALLTGGVDGVPPVPSVEVFFARQAAGSGIAPHTDGCNFILTSHLALIAQADKAYIDVGGVRRYWAEGKAMVFDTSYVHSTMNTGDASRYVLLVRLWHPDVTAAEREALGWIFAALEDPRLVDEVLGPEVPGGGGGGGAAARDGGGGVARDRPWIGRGGDRLPRAERRRQERAKRKAAGRGGGRGGLAPADAAGGHAGGGAWGWRVAQVRGATKGSAMLVTCARFAASMPARRPAAACGRS
ncbi:hypothetical protein BU14_0027s0130 [Porphyra umbilicalis]|uniref:Aspartyl/asparaginy/proline hydroxylase domain-containing protein n=1 Tax=Porphyra umbilicalis TaxID=2786 RepID=A0A1X6PK80_PORUM|nr:hypothetical protein BU14_0027s0130 [Porphyra umbilicalis]|eukprot:OSX81108.1 hypothetical protein BU14_0027s0130 [Porphyra umbilicalis]